MSKVELFETDFCQKLEKSLQDGDILLLYMDADRLQCQQSKQPLSTANICFISKVLSRDFTLDPDTKLYTVETDHSEVITIHPDFQLYLISSKHLNNVLASGSNCLALHQCNLQLSNFCNIDGALSLEGMERHLQRFIVTHEKPEYKVRYKSLLTDLILHQQQLADSQVLQM